MHSLLTLDQISEDTIKMDLKRKEKFVAHDANTEASASCTHSAAVTSDSVKYHF